MSDILHFWGPGSEELHSDTEQQKRQNSARTIILDSSMITVDQKIASIKNYAVSLYACTCRDFIIRRRPCKHMYRLAHKLGFYCIELEERLFFDRSAIKDVISALPDPARNILDAYLYADIYNHPEFEHATYLCSDEGIKELIDSNLMTGVESDNALGLRKSTCERLMHGLDSGNVPYSRRWNGKRRLDLVIDPAYFANGIAFIKLSLPAELEQHKKAMYMHICKLRPPAPTITCPHCGSETPEDFPLCNNCWRSIDND